MQRPVLIMSDTVILSKGIERTMINNKKGSSAVFLSLILAALISITLALIYGAREETVKSRSDGLINLAGDSVLSEFNYEVQKEYGLFMIKGTDRQLSKKLRKYISYSIDSMEDVTIDKVNVSCSRHSFIDTDRAKEQILQHMKFAAIRNIAVKTSNPSSSVENENQGSGEKQADKLDEAKTLRNGPTIVSLPSKDMPGRSLTALAESIADKAGDVESVFKAGSDKYMLNSYILGYFNNRVETVSENHFFKNEVEYILGGELSDRKNEKRVEMALKAMRFPLNLSHIYADAEKKAAVMAAAEIITPGPAAAATQLVLATTWAYAESDNDVELLWEGKKVPMIKDNTTWAIDLDSAVEGITGGRAYPDVEKGYDYSQYLQILLFFEDDNMKVARILDLIQINMRKCYDKNFLVQEHGAGISIDVSINGRDYSYEKKY